MKQDRLDKILCGTGLYTRSEARALILAGGVTVNGAPVRRPETRVDRASAIMAGGEPVDGAEFLYLMMNKPAQYISGTRDEKYPAVTGLLPRHQQARGLFPAGRLDADVTGLLILTDDGAFAHRLTAPRQEVPKTYEAWVENPMSFQAADILRAGVPDGAGGAYKPAELSVDPADPCHAWVTVTEGRFHEVKNLLAYCGSPVVKMRRISIGGLQLDPALGPGEFRPMTEEEVQACFA